MEDPMDENEDDNLDQGWEIEREKNKTKIDQQGGVVGF